ncbi:hypothetical protein HOP50_16g77500 [Chloropicon primus]|uniref:Protein kinase domain-containing protein n=1 Tax=Chloropicon primus TaxID=1764295 RepID=A0A5B8N0D2_9CHLO|nr:hypothetical protein A3770_16p77220 [Chloropicon primus]UPR04409.1 hypothetical protein HOP50_16g77500 [Chloropicon primus]|eukprot:QDZ25204.1 hypothetical protein A3770_16p77220 [Chloropicon primus]
MGKVAVRVVQSKVVREVLKELKTIVSIPGTTIETYGVTYVRQDDEEGYLIALVVELCEMDVDAYIAVNHRSLGLTGRIGLMLRVFEGIEELKASGVVWRDLKGGNMLIKRTEGVEGVEVRFCDFGTAVRLKDRSNRRMTISGAAGATPGYIAPETKSPSYSFASDMFSCLVWCASLCLDFDKTGAGELEHRIAKLRLNQVYSSSRKAEEKKVKRKLKEFVDEDLIRNDCLPLFTFLASDQVAWTDPENRPTAKECSALLSNLSSTKESPLREERSAERKCLSPSSGIRSLKIGGELGEDKENSKSKTPLKAPKRSTRRRNPLSALAVNK